MRLQDEVSSLYSPMRRNQSETGSQGLIELSTISHGCTWGLRYSVVACLQLKQLPLHLLVITPILPGGVLPRSTCCGTTSVAFLAHCSAGLPGRVSVGGVCLLSVSSQSGSALPLS